METLLALSPCVGAIGIFGEEKHLYIRLYTHLKSVRSSESITCVACWPRTKNRVKSAIKKKEIYIGALKYVLYKRPRDESRCIV